MYIPDGWAEEHADWNAWRLPNPEDLKYIYIYIFRFLFFAQRVQMYLWFRSVACLARRACLVSTCLGIRDGFIKSFKPKIQGTFTYDDPGPGEESCFTTQDVRHSQIRWRGCTLEVLLVAWWLSQHLARVFWDKHAMYHNTLGIAAKLAWRNNCCMK